MHSAITLASLYLSVCAVSAIAVQDTTSVKYVANFEDIKNVNPVIGFGPPTPYKG
ncbi:unnamed protein product [Cercospora beticola]|nr:unnamed protein product [Cercospora beticola]